MMSRHFRLSSEISGAIAKRLPHAKNQLSVTGSFFNQFVTHIYIYTQYTLANPNSSVPMFEKIVRISEFVPISEITLIQ